MKIVKVDPGIHITDMQVKIDKNSSGEIITAVSHFRANGTVVAVSTHQHMASRWNLVWEKTSQEWKIISLERLDPITGKVIATLNQG